MKTFVAIVLTLLLAGWLWLVVSLAEPPRVYVWTVQPMTAPLSEVVEQPHFKHRGCLSVGCLSTFDRGGAVQIPR